MRRRRCHCLELLLLAALAGCMEPALDHRPETAPTAAAIKQRPLLTATPTPAAAAAATPLAEGTQTPAPGPSPIAQGPSTTATSAPQAVLPTNAIWVFAGDQLVAAGQSSQVINLAHELQHTRIAQLDAAPDGSLLVFSTGALLYAVDPGSGRERILLERRGWTANSPHFSPDGRQLAFTSTSPWGWELLALDVTSEHWDLVQQGNGHESLLPVGWTQAGIVVERVLYGTDALPQSLALLDPASGTLQPLRSEGHRSAMPAPDGSQVAISGGSHVLGEPQASSWLLLLDTATGAEEQLVAETAGWFSHLSWSPGGQRLLHLSAPDTRQGPDTIHVISPGEQAFTVGLAELGLAGTLRDARWRDNQTLLLLLAGEDAELRLYELALGQPAAASLRELTALSLAAPRDQLAQIVYVPRR